MTKGEFTRRVSFAYPAVQDLISEALASGIDHETIGRVLEEARWSATLWR